MVINTYNFHASLFVYNKPMRYFVPRLSKGFTLMELLVVISIIGLLASVVLASLSSARQKGRNSARVQQISQYIKALALYQSSSPTGGYPSVSGFVCLGDYPSPNSCWNNGNFSENTAFATALTPYIPSLPPGNKVGTFTGYIYDDSPVGSYRIWWMMEGGPIPPVPPTVNPYCQIAGATSPTLVSGNTRCEYSPK